MKKIFLDVGGHEGQSVRAGLDPIFGFDHIYCFEPVASSGANIRRAIPDHRLTVVDAGLFDVTERRSLGDAGAEGGSVYRADGVNVECQFLRASDFFRDTISPGDQVWMKLNCEGAEVAILNDLLDSGEASKLTEVLIDLDAAKYPELHDAARGLLERLPAAPFSYHYPPEVQYGMVNNFGAIHNWFVMSGAKAPTFGRRLARVAYQIRYMTDRKFNGYYKIRLLRALRLAAPAPLAARAIRHTWSPIDQMRGPYYNPETD